MPFYFYTYSHNKRYLFLCSLLFILSTAWYIIFLKPIRVYIYQVEHEVEQLTHYYESSVSFDKESAPHKKYNYYAELCKNKITELYGAWVHERALWLIDMLAQNNISLIKCNPLAPLVSKPTQDVYFVFVTQAHISAINNFFAAISQSPYILDCLRCDIKKITDTALSCKFLVKFSYLSSYRHV